MPVDLHAAAAESALVAAIAAVRKNPKALIKRLEERLEHFKGKDYYPPERGGKVAVATKEGTAAVHDAITYVSKLRALPDLYEPVDLIARRALRLAAEDHLVDKGELGTIGHDGRDGSSSSDRQSRYGVWSGACGECLWFGREGASPEAVVEDLIIDDNVRDRGHRLCLFDERYKVAVAKIGSHKIFGSMAVIEFATAFEGEEAKVRARESAGPPKLAALAASAAASQAIKTQWRNLGRCAGCGEPIQGGAVMETDKLGKFHKECFKCITCTKSLVGVPWKAEKTEAFCAECHVQAFAPECAGCGEKIAGAGVTVNGTPYHKECKPAASGGALMRHGPTPPRSARERLPRSKRRPLARRPRSEGSFKGSSGSMELWVEFSHL